MTQDGRTRDTRRRTTYDKVLFCILMVLLFLPLLQQHILHIPLKPLHGVTIETERPTFNLEAYRTGDFAKQEEAFVGEHFGFRESIIRMYNQYLWSCYRKTYAHDVVAGKFDWLYTAESVRDYYGTELYRWHPSAEAARESFDREIRYMSRVHDILKENDVELLTFIAPEKSFLYPEYLPEREHDTTTFNACDYFLKGFEENGIPCIDMTRWFQQMKDTVSYPIIPQMGAHWIFPAVIAADSLFRFMGQLKGIELPQIKIESLHERPNHGLDNELEHLLNLQLPLNHRFGFSPEAEISIVSDSTKEKPKVLFIGNSYMWGISSRIPLEEVFDEVEFWYYFSTAYYGDSLSQTASVVDYNLLEKLLDSDYIVWFTTGNQMNKGTMSFANTAILTLGVDDSLRRAYMHQIADTITVNVTDSTRYQEAIAVLNRHPELIPELQGDLTTQNNEIPYAKVIKDIRKDSVWMAALEAQAFLRSATMDQMLHAEVDRIKAGKSLYRDQAEEIRFSLLCQEEVKQRIGRIPDHEDLMEIIREKAIKQNKTLDKAIEDDAIWITREKYGLDHCRLIDDPDAVIPIPLNFQLN